MKTLMQPELPNEAVIEDCNHKTETECDEHGCWFAGNVAHPCAMAYYEDDPGRHDQCAHGWCQCTCHGTEEVITRIGHYWKDEDTDQIYLLGEAYKDGRRSIVQLVSLKSGQALHRDGQPQYWIVQHKDQITEREFRLVTRGFDLTRVPI